MSKVIFKYLKNKELCCPVCSETNDFIYKKGNPVVIKLRNGSEDALEMFQCGCGWVMLYDAVSRRITDDLWDEQHEGDTIIE